MQSTVSVASVAASCAPPIARGEKDLEVVSINDLTDTKTLAHLLKYDSVHGVFPFEVKATDKGIVVNGKEIQVTAVKSPAELPHAANGVDLVLECTGLFTEREKAEGHLKAGAKRVLISAPAKNPDITVAYGVNHQKLDRAKHHDHLQRLLHDQLPDARSPRSCSRTSASSAA